MAEFMYVGTFSPGGQGGYSVFRWDGKTRTASPVEDTLPDVSAGMTCFDPEKNILYFTDEKKKNPSFRFGGGGRVIAAKADPETGKLTRLNELPSYGANPSYVAADRKGEFAVVTNFGPFVHAEPVTKVGKNPDGSLSLKIVADDASVILYHLDPDGSLDRACDAFLLEPEGTPEAPEYPHGHCAVLSPDGKLFAVTDLGTSKVWLFCADREQAKLVPAGNAPLQCRKGSGPRYAAFHPSKPWLFVNFEDAPYIGSYRYSETGLEEISYVRVIPEDSAAKEGDNQSGIALSADGTVLYTAMRGRNQVMAFSVDQQTGILSLFQTYQLEGDRPKDLSISPDGRTLAAASRGNDCVELLAIAEDGTLSDTGKRVSHRAAGHVFFLKF
ncbi:MAG: beta-propeller fold lactonase family protein [Stomatobaculum sp.]|nr:beta-propeller fold lactonase family protein [Stomatobaculum sp.]